MAVQKQQNIELDYRVGDNRSIRLYRYQEKEFEEVRKKAEKFYKSKMDRQLLHRKAFDVFNQYISGELVSGNKSATI